MSTATQRLRDELRDDLDALRGFDVADWCRAAVDTVLAPGLVARATVHSVVYAINHAEPGTETSFSVAASPIAAPWWRPRDRLQASVLSLVTLGVFATPYASLPSDPLLASVVAMQSLPLALDPALTLWEVSG